MLQSVEVEVDSKIIKSAVLILRDEFERVRITPADSRNMDKFFAAYRDIHGEALPGEPRSLSLDEWRPYFIRRSTSDKARTANQRHFALPECSGQQGPPDRGR